MNIALMAHDNKKELMVQFCTAYCGILAKHTLCATARRGLSLHPRLRGGEEKPSKRVAININQVYDSPPALRPGR